MIDFLEDNLVCHVFSILFHPYNAMEKKGQNEHYLSTVAPTLFLRIEAAFLFSQVAA